MVANRKKTPQYLTALLQGKGKAEHANAVAANVALLLESYLVMMNLKQNVQKCVSSSASGKVI